VALAAATPVLVWNQERGWPSLMLHFVERRAPTDPATLALNAWHALVGQLGPLHPLVFPGLLVVLAICLRRSPRDDRFRFLALASWPVLLFFWVMMARVRDAESHWTMVGYISLAVAAGGLLDERIGRLSTALRCYIAACIAITLAGTAVFYAYAQDPSLRRFLPTGAYDPDRDFFNEMPGWPEVRAAVTQEAAALGPATVVASCQYALCAHVLTALDDRPPVYCPGPRRTEFDFLGRGDPPARAPVLYVHADNYHDDPSAVLPDRACRAIRILPVEREGVVMQRYHLWACSPARGLTVGSTLSARCSGAQLDLIVGWQLRHPGRVLGVIAALTVLSIGLCHPAPGGDQLQSLLPQTRPSVVELRRVSARTSSLSTIFVVLEGQDPAGLRRAVDALVPALRALGPPWVGSVESGVHDALAFLRPRTGLYTDLATLKQLRDDVEARYAYEVGKETGLQLGLEEEPPPPIAPDTVKSRLGVKAEDERRFPGDGRYQSADGKKAVVLIRSGVVGADFQKAEEAVARVSEVVKRVNPASFDPAAKWDLSGDLLIGLAEYRLINRDLTEVGLAGTVLILGIVFLYYLRIRTVVSMGLGIGIGVAWTFALTELFIGRLNLATGFLFTIIAGNGINFSILLMARYLEERRHGTPSEAAILEAMRCTWRPTLTAAATASAAYGALVVTEFKGFREFGWIGGMGMLVCWAAAFLALPPMLLLIERWVPLERVSWWRRALRIHGEGVPFGEPFARLVASAPRTITVVGIALAIVGAVLTVVYVRSDPMEYDTNRIRATATPSPRCTACSMASSSPAPWEWTGWR
jgi:hypothetical protein